MSHIAVVGAGIAGLTVADELQSAGHVVSLLEKSQGPGGRCATRRSAAGPFDHGAPSFTATTAAFRAQVTAWRDAGWVAVEGGRRESTGFEAPLRACGFPSMNTLAQQIARSLSSGVDMRTDTPVASIEPSDHDAADTGAQTGWRLRLLDGRLDTTRFDAVVVAVPAEQAAVLLGSDSALAEAMRQTCSDPCWTVMAAWPNQLPTLQGEYRSTDPLGVLSLARRDDARIDRGNVPGIGSRWVLHATPYWSADHLDAAAADVIADLVGALATQSGVDIAAPVHAAAHRWRYGQVPKPRPEPCGWNAMLRLGSCGDAWHGGARGADRPRVDGVERAWLSGRALAREMIRSLPRD